MNYSGFDESILEYEFGSAVSYLQMQTWHSQKNSVVAETLNPKKYKIAQREALM
jgi:hypothetical protein